MWALVCKDVEYLVSCLSPPMARVCTVQSPRPHIQSRNVPVWSISNLNFEGVVLGVAWCGTLLKFTN